MSSILHLKEFILKRMTAAAEEIFAEVEKNVIQYEEMIDHQQKQLESTWKPKEDSETDVPHQDLCKTKEDTNQVKAEPIKEEQEDLVIQMEEQFALKSENEKCLISSNHEENILTEQKLNKDGVPDFTFHMDEYSEENPTETQRPASSSDSCLLKNVDENVENSLPSESHSRAELTTEKMFVCHFCNKEFYYLLNLKKHMGVHSRVKMFPCTLCGKSYSRKEALFQHMEIHSDGKLYSCTGCGKCFGQHHTRSCKEKSHLKNKPSLCKECKESFAVNVQLQSDFRNQKYSIDPISGKFQPHAVEEIYSCKTCGESFNLRDDLLSHLPIHTIKKGFPCKTCGKCFTRKDTLVGHMRIHTGEKPYLCIDCGKRFIHKNILLRHRRIHTGEVYSCEQCGKGFHRRAYLKSHMKNHSDKI